MSSVRRDDRYRVRVGPLGADLEVGPDDSESGVAVVEHSLPPKTLGAPLHRHAREDEISYVLAGELTVQADGEISTVPAGEFVVKGRDVWHAFWNAGDDPVRFLEIIAPGDFSGFFAAVADHLSGGPPDEAAMARVDELAERYGLEFDWGSVPDLCERHGIAPM
ncbi:cupin domain-containing protein [Salinigranum sp.]|uniref:cupin domain-containing protein n=1 Tax=Salinigranum sp. TaxID=1966351 RepID=UPI00356A5E39